TTTTMLDARSGDRERADLAQTADEVWGATIALTTVFVFGSTWMGAWSAMRMRDDASGMSASAVAFATVAASYQAAAIFNGNVALGATGPALSAGLAIVLPFGGAWSGTFVRPRRVLAVAWIALFLVMVVASYLIGSRLQHLP